MPHPSGAPVLSPPASASPPISSVSQHTSALPSTRAHPLTPGSSKEIALINYLDDKLLRITRRYAKKFSSEHSQLEESPGYTNFDEVVADLDVIFDIVWISGTRKKLEPQLTCVCICCSVAMLAETSYASWAHKLTSRSYYSNSISPHYRGHCMLLHVLVFLFNCHVLVPSQTRHGIL